MPELPEVETIVRGLDHPLERRRIVRATLRPVSLYRKGSLKVGWLVGRVISRVGRVGKNAVFWFEPQGVMAVNLGMTGRLVLAQGDLSRSSHDKRHLHGRFALLGDLNLCYYDTRRFGYVYVAEICDFRRDLNIGPDPFQARPMRLRKTLSGRSAPIKSLLLDQRIVSGLGNIYTDELLFEAGVHPLTPGDAVSGKARDLLSAARRILGRAIAHGGSTVRDYRKHDGSRGGFQRFHAVYGRKDKPCLRCGTPIRKITLSGRGTHFCPVCQS